jgi:hypothetical protein
VPRATCTRTLSGRPGGRSGSSAPTSSSRERFGQATRGRRATARRSWRDRIRGLRANASTRSHEELDEAEELDEGDPADLGARYADLRDALPRLNVLGGCCGTDHRHVAASRDAWLAGSGG